MIIIAVIILVLLLIGIGMYNALIGKKNQVTNAFSAIDVMLKKRFDLLPNLVEIVQQYTKYEGDLLAKVVELRSKASNSNLSTSDKIALDKELGAGVKNLMVTVEAYPELKANQNFMHLQAAWTESEEQIAAARRTYNATVTEYNNAIMMFPGSIFASMLNYQPITVLESTEAERKNISAKELFNN